MLKFTVTDEKNKTVSVVGCDKEVSGELNIPETVTYNGVTYKVTELGNNGAFRGYSKLTAVTIPASITAFGAGGTFEGCSGLTSVTLLGSDIDFGRAPFLNVGTEEDPVTLYVTSDWEGSTPTDSKTKWNGGYFKLDTLRKVTVMDGVTNGTVTAIVPEYVPDSAEDDARTVTLYCTPDDGYVPSKEYSYDTARGTPQNWTITADSITFTMPKGADVSVKPKFIEHTHTWEYAASGNVIKAYCTDSVCPDYYGEAKALTLTLTAENADFTNAAYTGASIADDITSVTGDTAPTIMYKGVDGTTYPETSSAPTDAGTYTASVTLGGKTATMQFTINKIDQTITTGDDVTMTIGDTDKSVTAAVTVGDGTISYTISPATGLAVASDSKLTATAAGTYTVTAKASGTTNYNETTCADTITVTVSKKTQTITAPASFTVTYGTPADIGATTDGDGTLSYESNNTALCTVDSTGKVTFVSADESDSNFVTVKAAETDTYAAAEAKVAIKTQKASLTFAFADNDPTAAYAGELVGDVKARFTGKLTGLVTGDNASDYGTVFAMITSGGSEQLDTDELSVPKLIVPFCSLPRTERRRTATPSISP